VFYNNTLCLKKCIETDRNIDRKLPQTVNNMKIETSISLEIRDEEVEIYGKPNCWDIGRG